MRCFIALLVLHLRKKKEVSVDCITFGLTYIILISGFMVVLLK